MIEHSIIELQSVNKSVIGFKSCFQVVLANAASPNNFFFFFKYSNIKQ